VKIAISATGPGLDAEVDPRFGRCPYSTLAAATFMTDGYGTSIASGSMVTEIARGKSISAGRGAASVVRAGNATGNGGVN